METRTVADIGEIELVDRILAILSAGDGDAAASRVVVGPGDDAAVLACDGDVVLTVDSQHEGVHFERELISARLLGRRAVAVNASDLGAMGARPTGFLVALALPPGTAVEWVEDLARGLHEGARRWGAAIVGGDVAAVPERVAINVTAVGERPRGITVARSGARPGQRLLVSGWPGRAGAGMRLLQAGGEPIDPGAQRCIDAFLEPAPPVDFGVALARRGLASAMIDISDGVAIDLGRVCRASRVGARLDGAALLADPVLEAVAGELAMGARELVLGGGEDYELLCAIDAGDAGAVRSLAAEHGVEVRDIGAVVDSGQGITLAVDGAVEPLEARGWDHFE